MPYNSRDSDILRALQAGDVLTPAVAHTRWGVLALHSAIARLREKGHPIATKMVKGHGEYRLTKAAPQSAAVIPHGQPDTRITADAAHDEPSPCFDRQGRLMCYAVGGYR